MGNGIGCASTEVSPQPQVRWGHALGHTQQPSFRGAGKGGGEEGVSWEVASPREPHSQGHQGGDDHCTPGPLATRKGRSWMRMRPEVVASWQRPTHAVLRSSKHSVGQLSPERAWDGTAEWLSGLIPYLATSAWLGSPSVSVFSGSALPRFFLVCSFSSIRPLHEVSFINTSSLSIVSMGPFSHRPPTLHPCIPYFLHTTCHKLREFCLLLLRSVWLSVWPTGGPLSHLLTELRDVRKSVLHTDVEMFV